MKTTSPADLLHEDLDTLLRTVRRHLHQYPEVGFHEVHTHRYLKEVLEMHGLEVHGPIARTGLYVDIVGDAAGPTVAYRSDIDALPTQDEKNVDYRSTVNGVAHLCGHDAHSAIAVGLALLLNERRELLPGTVRVFFQPNEEGIPSGAPAMIEDGVLDSVAAVFASHVDPTLATGCYGLISGPATASADRFTIRARGHASGHSARPHQSTDTVWIMSQIMSVLYQIVGRQSDARDTAIISICRMTGGEAFNVIPACAEIGGTLRCISNDERCVLQERMEHAARAIGQMHGAQVDVEFDIGSPPVHNAPELVSLVRDVILDTHGPDAIFEIPRPSMGGEDFAHYLQHVPGMLLRVGTSDGPATSHPLHDSCFDVDEAAIPLTSRILADILTRALTQAHVSTP